MTVETLQQSTSSLHIYLRWLLIIGCILTPSKSPKKWTAVNHSSKFGSVEDGEKTPSKFKNRINERGQVYAKEQAQASVESLQHCC